MRLTPSRLAACTALLLACSAAPRVRRQANDARAAYCAPDDGYMTGLLGFARQEGADSSAATTRWRESNHFPTADPTQVLPVTDEAICERISALWYAGVPDSVSRFPMYVIDIGGKGYLISERHFHVGEWGGMCTVDRAITKVFTCLTM